MRGTPLSWLASPCATACHNLGRAPSIPNGSGCRNFLDVYDVGIAAFQPDADNNGSMTDVWAGLKTWNDQKFAGLRTILE
jgi:hypothetical protein